MLDALCEEQWRDTTTLVHCRFISAYLKDMTLPKCEKHIVRVRILDLQANVPSRCEKGSQQVGIFF